MGAGPGRGPLVAGAVLGLTTTGRRSGAARTVEIWFTALAGRLYVIAEHGERTHWVRNIRADPRVRVRLGGVGFPARARVLQPVRDQRLWRRVCALSRRKYGWGEGLPVEIDPGGLPAGKAGGRPTKPRE